METPNFLILGKNLVRYQDVHYKTTYEVGNNLLSHLDQLRQGGYFKYLFSEPTDLKSNFKLIRRTVSSLVGEFNVIFIEQNINDGYDTSYKERKIRGMHPLNLYEVVCFALHLLPFLLPDPNLGLANEVVCELIQRSPLHNEIDSAKTLLNAWGIYD